MLKRFAALSLVSLVASTAFAADADPCKAFKWDVSHELAVFTQAPESVVAATSTANAAPELRLDKLYEVKLTDQGSVTFAVPPVKPTLPDGTQAGMVQFKSAAAGRYRVAITSHHWLDVIDGQAPIKSRDFHSAHGCQRPQKIVEFDLPAQRPLTLQLSGASETPVTLAITEVTSATK